MDRYELPSGWVWTSFIEIVENSPYALKAGPFGSALKKSFYVPKGYKIYGQEQVIRGDPFYGDYYIDEEHYQALKSCAVKPGDILISLVGTIGKVLILPENIEPGIINPRLVKLSLDKAVVNTTYIKLYLESNTARRFFSVSSHGGTMDILNLSILKELPIPLPPILEQQRIVDEIDTQLSRLDAVVNVLKRAQITLKRYRASVLKTACEGRLVSQDPTDESASQLLERILAERRRQWNGFDQDTESIPLDTSDLPKLPVGWVWVNLGDVIEILTDYHANGSYELLKANVELLDEPGYAIMLRTTNFSEKNAENYKYISKKAYEFLVKSKVYPGDIIMNKIGDPGTVFLVPNLNHLMSLAMNLFLIRLNKQAALNSYGYYYLVAHNEYVRSFTKGTTTKTITKKAVRELVFPLPPLAEQQRIVEEVERRLSVMDEVEATLEANLKRAERLRQSILKRAFEGKLVPQNPADEPASVLLERIREAKAKGKESRQMELPGVA